MGYISKWFVHRQQEDLFVVAQHTTRERQRRDSLERPRQHRTNRTVRHCYREHVDLQESHHLGGPIFGICFFVESGIFRCSSFGNPQINPEKERPRACSKRKRQAFHTTGES